MKIVPVHGILVTAALGLTFAGGAAVAQSTRTPAPGSISPPAPMAPRGASSLNNTAEPSAATPGTAATPATTSKTGSAETAKLSRDSTQRFVSQAAYANDAEIADARYAVAHSQSPEIKEFARRMITDHTKAGNQLKQIADSEGYAVPSGLDHTDRSAMNSLERDHGARFNAAYSLSQDRDHRRVVALFKRAEQNPHIAPQVRSFARTTLPVLQDHLQMANKLVASETGGNHKAG